MKNYKKTFWGSIVAFFVGTSCCWLGTLAIWIGGAAFVGTITGLIEDVQFLLVGLGIMLLMFTIFLYVKMKT
ncbi:MAG: hypothetical protein V3V00_03890 [Saprospiraceae bacterium]